MSVSFSKFREVIFYCETVMKETAKIESELGQNRCRDKDLLKIMEKCRTIVSIIQTDPPF